MQPNDSADELVLGGRYQIYPDKPLPNYDHAAAFALNAADKRMPERPLTAMVCRPGLVPRLDIISQMSRLMRLPMIVPIDAGPIIWPETGGRRYVVVFDRAAGAAVAGPLGEKFEPLREDQVIHRIIKPILPALKELSGRSIKHRAIRANNIFYTDTTCQSAVLGECVSGPPGMSQPALYEPVDAAMADDAGRGYGSYSDDMYAFGVLMAVLLTGGNPVEGMSDEEIIDSKIRTGSYSTLIGSLTLSLRIIEPLRGLLCDDAAQRWTVDDLEVWANGRQLSPKQPMLPVKASRAIQFDGQEYMTKPTLSLAMGRRWQQAAKIVTSGELANWLRRSFGDDESADAIEALLSNSGEGVQSEYQLISSALAVLEPYHPIRYRQISARIDGLATALAVNYADQDFRNSFVEMMKAKLPQQFLKSSPGKNSERSLLVKTYDMFCHFLERQQLGAGLERALYEANRGWPCQSPLIAGDYVCEIDDLLPALERMARRGSAQEQLIDRHIAGFCGARSKTLAEILPRLLGSPVDLAKERMGILAVYAEVHRITGPSQRYPALTAWLAAMATPVFDSYHNRAVRDQLQKTVDRVGGKGDILSLYTVLNDSVTKGNDAAFFEEARNEYGQLENSINWLNEGGLSAPKHVIVKSQQAATFLSAVISSFIVVALSIVFVT